MALHDRIRQLRKDAKLSCEAFAQIFGVSRQSVQKWESGAAAPEISKIIEISKYFDMKIEDVFIFEED